MSTQSPAPYAERTEQLGNRIAQAFGLLNQDIIDAYVADVLAAEVGGRMCVTLTHGGKSLMLHLNP